MAARDREFSTVLALERLFALPFAEALAEAARLAMSRQAADQLTAECFFAAYEPLARAAA